MHIRINLYICIIHTYIHSYYVIGRHENKLFSGKAKKMIIRTLNRSVIAQRIRQQTRTHDLYKI